MSGQAMKQLKQDFTRLHEEHGKMVDRLRTCNPPPASLGGHLLALKDPATGLPLTDGQLEAEMVTLFVAGVPSLSLPFSDPGLRIRNAARSPSSPSQVSRTYLPMRPGYY